jgi:hypothetical protein
LQRFAVGFKLFALLNLDLRSMKTMIKLKK